jgi:hypothetical protein
MKKFYTIEQIADWLVASTRTAHIGDKRPGQNRRACKSPKKLAHYAARGDSDRARETTENGT